jgi:type IV secretory pathway VirB6-like protein
MKTQNFFKSKETISRVMKQHTKLEKILSSYSTNTGLIYRIYKELKKLYTKRTNTPMNKWATELNTQFSEEVQMANKCMKKISK